MLSQARVIPKKLSIMERIVLSLRLPILFNDGSADGIIREQLDVAVDEVRACPFHSQRDLIRRVILRPHQICLYSDNLQSLTNNVLLFDILQLTIARRYFYSNPDLFGHTLGLGSRSTPVAFEGTMGIVTSPS